MKLDGAATSVLLRDVQMHPFRNEILHVDFQRIDENEEDPHEGAAALRQRAKCRRRSRRQGAIISHVTTELDIACLPKDLPEFIEVDLSGLDVGHSMHVSGVKLPPGVTAVTHGKVDPVVATAVVPKAAVETEETVAAAAERCRRRRRPRRGQAGAEAKGAEKGGEKKEAGKDDKKK